MKKMLAILLAVVLLTGFSSVLAEQAAKEPVVITVFHTNDVHANAEASSSGMGYAMMAGYVSAAKSASENVMVLDAGDTFHGTVFATAVQGASIAQILNAVGYDAITPGNHDFNYGFDRLKELESSLTFPMINCNIYTTDGKHAFTPYLIKEVGGKKIGIIGVATPDMVPKIHPDRLTGLEFRGLEEVEKCIAEIEGETDAIILLSHWGITGEEITSDVLAKLSNVDLVIDGHSHDAWPEGQPVEGGALIVSSGEKLNNLGKVTLTFDGDKLAVKAELIPAPKVFEDRTILNSIEEVKAAQDVTLQVVVGKTAVDLDGERADVRTKETNLGNLAADAILEYSGADIAFTNGGGIRASIPAGDITLKHVVTVFPFGNIVVTKEISGADIKAALEHGLRMYPDQNGGFPQFAGMQVKFDPKKDAGSRVVEVLVGGAPMEDGKMYILATNDFTAAGGDGYGMFAPGDVLKEFGGLDEALKNYLVSHGEVSPQVEGRLTMVE